MSRCRDLLLAVLAAVGCIGCAETREVTIYMQNLEVQGPITHPPIHITKDTDAPGIHIIPRISFATQRTIEAGIEGHTMVSPKGVFYVDTVVRADNGVYFQDPGTVNTYPFRGKNLRWRIPSTSIGVDIDVGLSRATSLALGATYSSIERNGVWTYRAGLGFANSAPGRTLGFRFDAGWIWQEHIYDATTVITERPLSSSTSTVMFFQDREKTTDGNFYAALTFNTISPDRPWDFFFQAGLTKQNISELKPRAPQPQTWIVPPFFLFVDQSLIVRDLRGEFAATLVHFSPGMSFDVSESASIVFGVRFTLATGIENPSPGTIVSPILQFDWAF